MAPAVPDFYAGKSIFITGGSGFVGKALIFKLLKSCPDVKTIYLLLRRKKGINSEDRLKELCENRIYDSLRETNPDIFRKLKLIPGDIIEDELGISDEHRTELQAECNIIFHSAACVRFDQTLKDVININTKGTLKMLTLAESMQNLEVFLHLSTAYCRCELEVLEEKLYKAVHNPRHVMDMVEWMDDDLLQYIEPKLIASEPNTYSYTKAITEDLVAEYGDKFPIAIARPSIVIAAWKEPLPGWVDRTMQGPTGLIIGSGKGVIRSMHCVPSYISDAIAVDVVVNGCILAAYATALDKPRQTEVYNLTLHEMHILTWEYVINIGKELYNEYPLTTALWYPGGTIKSYWITHQICVILFHYIPAYFIDALLLLIRRKPFLVRIQKRISNGLSVLQYYTTKQFHFPNHKILALRNRVSEKDWQEFCFDTSNGDIQEYLRNYIKGIREFCCLEDPSTLPRARRLHTIRYFADRTAKTIFLLLVVWILYNNYHIFITMLEWFDNVLKSLLCLI